MSESLLWKTALCGAKTERRKLVKWIERHEASRLLRAETAAHSLFCTLSCQGFCSRCKSHVMITGETTRQKASLILAGL